MTDFFNLVEHRKIVQSHTLRLAEDLVVIPMEQSNDDELRNEIRHLESRKAAKKVNRLLEEAADLSDEDKDEAAAAKVTEAGTLTQNGFTMMLETLQTIVCTEEGKKVPLAKLRAAIGSQDECQAVMDAVAAARVVDPPTPKRERSTRG